MANAILGRVPAGWSEYAELVSFVVFQTTHSVCPFFLIGTLRKGCATTKACPF